MNKYILNIVPLAPIRESSVLNVSLNNVTAITFRNSGETTLSLWNGGWDMLPGETLSFNVLENSAILNITPISVVFQDVIGQENKLQVVVTSNTIC